GRTTLGNRAISLAAMADDVDELLGRLGVERADVLGHSMGGGVALRLAVQHPARVRRLVLLSTGFAQEGFYAEMLPQQAAVGAAMAEMMRPTPIYQTYARIAPVPQD